MLAQLERPLLALFAVLILLMSFAPSAMSQEGAETPPSPEQIREMMKAQGWKMAGSTLNIGSNAILELPEGLAGLEGDAAERHSQSLGNPPGNTIAIVGPDNGEGWLLYFEFDDIGYVKDDEKDEIDADELLDQMKDMQKEANKVRSKNGLETYELKGYSQKPKYDESLNAMTWGFKLRWSQGYDNINHEIRFLGRRGVMGTTLACSPGEYDTILPKTKQVLKNFKFLPSHRYDDFKEGDKIAEYGLIGLVAGGAILGLAKFGFLRKFWKVIAAGVAGLFAFAKRLFGGGKRQAA